MYLVVLNFVVLKAAMTLILAAAMLSGGTSSQRREAEAFVKAELAGHHRRGTSGRLIEGLKSAVEMDGDGVLVSKRKKAYFVPERNCYIVWAPRI